MAIHIKRIYEPLSKSDGYRILVDRLWPRGMKKEDAHIDQWMKEIAPSTELRKWFGHEPGKWKDFQAKYLAELKNAPALDELLMLATQHETLTLLYAAKDEQHNHAHIILQLLTKHGIE